MAKFLGSAPAPRFPDDAVRFNCSTDFGPNSCAGRLVLLYFCNNASLVALRGLEQLQALRQLYGDSVAVIVIHSARYRAEKARRLVEDASRRYNRAELPLIHDDERRIWDAYFVNSSPTLIFVDHKGNVVTRHRGEFDFDGLKKIVGTMLTEYGLEFKANQSVAFPPPPEPNPPEQLSYPTCIELCDTDLCVADSGNGRIVLLDKAGKFKSALTEIEGERLREPGGIVFDGSNCYFADTALGGIARFQPTKPQDARWVVKPQSTISHNICDLAFYKGELYATMALFNQIWKVDTATGRLEAWVGTGKFGNWDDVRAEALLAQPMALVSNGGLLFADSENNTVRVVNPATSGRVVTLAGGGLHDWGDYDAEAREARLQHPRGIAYANNVLYIADTYNHKIKQMDIRTLKVKTLAGTGEAGFQDGKAAEAQFNNPSGLKIIGDKLHIADTNNHKIRVLDLTNSEVTTKSG